MAYTKYHQKPFPIVSILTPKLLLNFFRSEIYSQKNIKISIIGKLIALSFRSESQFKLVRSIKNIKLEDKNIVT